jgi:Fe-S cluster assembly protein SufD
MAIHSFLKAEKGDPDWQFSPEDYFEKEFKIIDASTVELVEGKQEHVVLRQNPTEKELLAKHLKICLQNESGLDLIILNELDSSLQQVFLYDIHLKAGANLNLGLFVKDGKFNKHIIQIIQEENSVFSTYGLISNSVCGDTEVITKVVHNGPESISNQLFLGVAGENSQTVFQGSTIVDELAEDSQAAIESSNLIAGVNGRCFSKPETYINSEFSVSAMGAETNTISMEKIGYLQTRGISEEDAQKIIINSFRKQVINLIQNDSVREEAKEMYSD